MLARLFAGEAAGFYIDIGAGDPTQLSVTRHFYELGWRGINVEPIRANWERFVKERPRDINLNVAIAGEAGRREFCEVVDNDALSSLDTARIGELAAGGVRIQRYEVDCVTGDSLFLQCPAEVDFLKIDVEGAEHEVLRSIDLTRHRPKALVIEATAQAAAFPGWAQWSPMAHARWDAWEPRVLGSGYVFAHFDGLNRFYLREDLRHLAARLQIPPGVFDFIVPDLQESLLRDRRAADAAYAAALEGQEAQGNAQRAALNAKIAALTQDLAARVAERDLQAIALQEKEAVIVELGAAVTAFRSAFGALQYVIRPARALKRVARPIARVPRVLLAPRLGILQQHAPRELRLPPHYHQPAKLANAPSISIVTPSFRQAEFIERTMKSVLDQSYPELEYFVQDGGSRDGTVEIIQRYADRLSGWDSRPDRGQAEAVNLGFARTKGEIMGWINSDDILIPGALACIGDFFHRHPGVDVVYGHRILIDENDRQIGRWVMPSHDDAVLSWADFVPQETLFWRRSLWERSGAKVDETFRFALDWDLLVRFREAGARFARLPRFIGGFRIHSKQKTSAEIADIGFQEMNRIRERALGRVPSNIEVRNAVAPYLMRHVLSDIPWRFRERFLGGTI